MACSVTRSPTNPSSSGCLCWKFQPSTRARPAPDVDMSRGAIGGTGDTSSVYLVGSRRMRIVSQA